MHEDALRDCIFFILCKFSKYFIQNALYLQLKLLICNNTYDNTYALILTFIKFHELLIARSSVGYSFCYNQLLHTIHTSNIAIQCVKELTLQKLPPFVSQRVLCKMTENIDCIYIRLLLGWYCPLFIATNDIYC